MTSGEFGLSEKRTQSTQARSTKSAQRSRRTSILTEKGKGIFRGLAPNDDQFKQNLCPLQEHGLELLALSLLTARTLGAYVGIHIVGEAESLGVDAVGYSSRSFNTVSRTVAGIVGHTSELAAEHTRGVCRRFQCARLVHSARHAATR